MANKRRANGEGSWWQLPDRTWVHQITIGRKENGSPERKSFKGKTKAICKQRKEEWLAEQEHMKALEEASKREDAQKEEMQNALGIQWSRKRNSRMLLWTGSVFTSPRRPESHRPTQAI